MTRTQWDRLDESTFNQLVEALLVAEFTGDGLRAQAINGRGGDGGIDVDVRAERTKQLTQIFQLKYFPEGFSGGFRQRRSQIKESFTTALKEKPPVWVLVVPKNPTVKERQFLWSMASGNSVTVRIYGPAQLDELLSKHPEIEAYFNRNGAIEVLREVNRPEAALAKPRDLRAEVGRLQDRLAGRSQYWGMAFAVEPGGTYVETLYAKRNDAADREPLSITLQAQFTPENEALRAEFEDKMKYGGSGTIILPPEVVKEVRHDGPEWFAETSGPSEVHIGAPVDHEAQPVRVELYDGDGALQGQLAGTTIALDRGYGGTSVETALTGGLNMRWRFSDEHEEGGSVTLNYDPAGASAREVRRALRFISSLQAGTQIRLTVADGPALKVNLAQAADFGPADELRELVDDLCYIEDQLDITLTFQEEPDLSDRLWARVVVRILKGEPTPMPFVDSLTGTLSGTRDDGLDLLLSEGVAICASHADWAVQMFGQTVHLGPVYVFSHHARASNATAIRVNRPRFCAASIRVPSPVGMAC